MALEGISKDSPLEFKLSDSDIVRKTKYDYNLIKNIFTHIFDKPNHLNEFQASNNATLNNCSKYLKDLDENCHPLKKLISSLNNAPSKENNLVNPNQESLPIGINQTNHGSSSKMSRKRKMYANKSRSKKPFVLDKKSFFINYILKKPIELTPLSDASLSSTVESKATSSKSNLIEIDPSIKTPVKSEILEEKFEQVDNVNRDVKLISTLESGSVKNLKDIKFDVKELNEKARNDEDKRNFECFSTINSQTAENLVLLEPKLEKTIAVPPFLKNDGTDSCKETPEPFNISATGPAELSSSPTSTSIVNVAIMSDNAIDNAENLIPLNSSGNLIQINATENLIPEVQNVSDNKENSESSCSNSVTEIDPSTMSHSEDDSDSIASSPYPLERKSFYKFVYIRRFPKVEDLNEKPKIITKVLCKCKTIFSSEVKCLEHIERGCSYQIGRIN